MSLSPSLANVELWISFNDAAMLALSIPTSEATRLALRPLKWLRFLGFAITGQKGYLATSSTGPEIDNYGEEGIVAPAYYFIPDDEPHLVDVDAGDGRTSTACRCCQTDLSSLSSHRADFEQAVVDRDGSCVVCDNSRIICHASHIIPHSKGNEYISGLFRLRGATYGLVEESIDINDPCNGLLLISVLHLQMGLGWSAFLKTPNFGLAVDDIGHVPENDNTATSRVTLHHFFPDKGCISLRSSHNQDIRQPEGSSAFPPAIILDFTYAAMALKTWGTSTFIEYARKETGAPYYRQDSKSRPRYSISDAMDTVLGFQMLVAEASEPQIPGSPDPATNQDKVHTWLQTLEQTS